MSTKNCNYSQPVIEEIKYKVMCIFACLFSIVLVELCIGYSAMAGVSIIQGKSPYGQVHALCIGINDYSSKGIPDLQWAEADATALAKIFDDKYGYHTKLFLGAEATKHNIQEQLDSYRKSLQSEDVLIVTFAGHGQTVLRDGFRREGYILPVDAQLDLSDTRDAKAWRNRAISMKDFGLFIEDLPIRHVLLFADVCYSGFFGKRGAFGGRLDLQMLMQSPSRMIVTAGTEKQFALESGDFQHGLFTHALLESLATEKIQSVSEMFVQVRNRTANLSKGQMLPQLREITVENGEFVFVPKTKYYVAGTEFEKAMNYLNELRGAGTTVSHLFQAMEAVSPEYTLTAHDNMKIWEERFQQFEQNATLGNPLAMTALYYCYTKGLGTERDAERAKSWAMEAFETGHPAGIHAMAEFHRTSDDQYANELLADQLLEKAAEKKFSPSRGEIASYAIEKDKKQFDSYETWLREAYRDGSMKAGVTLAVRGALLKLKLRPQIQQAEATLTSLAGSGYPRAQYLLSKLYILGREGFPPPDAPPDEKKAWPLLYDAAKNGDSWAQVEVAAAYCQIPQWQSNSFGQPKDLKKCRQWAKLSVKQDNPYAMSMLYQIYRNGIGIPSNQEQARMYLEKALDKDLPWAFLEAGVCYESGSLYPKDSKKAIQYYKRSVELGESGAAVNLYVLYYNQVDWESFYRNKGVFAKGTDVQAFDEAYQWAGKAMYMDNKNFVSRFKSDLYKRVSPYKVRARYIVKRAMANWSSRPEILLLIAYCREAFTRYAFSYYGSEREYRNKTWAEFFKEYADKLSDSGYIEYAAVLRKAANK